MFASYPSDGRVFLASNPDGAVVVVVHLQRERQRQAGEALRQRLSVPVMEKLRGYLEKIRGEVLPKSPAARAVPGIGIPDATKTAQ